MAATFPSAVKSFSTFADYLDVDSSAHINELHDEIVAIESVLGPNPHQLHSATHVPGTLGTVLDTMDTNISTVLARTANPYATLLCGPTTGYNISASTSSALGGAVLQAYNNGVVSRLILNPNGGDVLIGSNSNVAVTGSVTVSATVTCGALAANTLAIGGVITAPGFRLQTSGQSFDLGNGNSIVNNGQSNGAGITLYNGDQHLSTHQFNGHVQVTGGRQFQGPSGWSGWAAAVLLLSRTSDTNSDLAFWSYYGGGVAAGWGFNGDQLNLGIQTWDATVPQSEVQGIHVPVTASAFVTQSTVASKEEVEDLPHGLETLRSLRPVHFLRPAPDCFAPARRDETGLLEPVINEDERQRLKAEFHHSAGDEKRFSTRYHGLIAEEVHEILPEVVHLDRTGAPYGIDYGSLVPLLINAVKELSDKVDALTKGGKKK